MADNAKKDAKPTASSKPSKDAKPTGKGKK